MRWLSNAEGARRATLRGAVLGRGNLLPAGLLLAAMVSVQGGAALATQMFGDVGPAATVMLRLLFAAAFIAVVVRPSLRAVRGRAFPIAGLGVSVALMNWLFYESIARIPLGTTVTLEFVGPLALALATSHRFADAGWALLAAIGVLLLGGTTGWSLGAGGILALAAGACWSAYIVLAHRVGRLFPNAVGLSLSMVIAAALLLPFGVVTGGSRLLSPTILWLGVIVAVLSSVIPYTLDMAALRMSSPRFYATFYSLEPAIAATIGAIFLQQGINGREAVAIVCVAAASVGVTWQLRKTTAPALEPLEP